MKGEIWSNAASVPELGEVIETVSAHCSNCGQPIRFIAPPKLQSDKELAEYYHKLAMHYADKWHQAEQIMRRLVEKIP